jgi:hypothetical protein
VPSPLPVHVFLGEGRLRSTAHRECEADRAGSVCVGLGGSGGMEQDVCWCTSFLVFINLTPHCPLRMVGPQPSAREEDGG